MKNACAEAEVIRFFVHGKQQLFAADGKHGVVQPRRQLFELGVSVRRIAERPVGQNGRKKSVAQHICPRRDIRFFDIVRAETAFYKTADTRLEKIFDGQRFNRETAWAHIRRNIENAATVFQVCDKIRSRRKRRIKRIICVANDKYPAPTPVKIRI